MTTTEPPRARPKAVRDSKPRTSSRTELRSWRLPECLPRMLGWCLNPWSHVGTSLARHAHRNPRPRDRHERVDRQ
jgi:hypothetical protein